MPELTPQERLQPALLDRLTDEEPATTKEPPGVIALMLVP